MLDSGAERQLLCQEKRLKDVPGSVVLEYGNVEWILLVLINYSEELSNRVLVSPKRMKESLPVWSLGVAERLKLLF